MSAGALACVCLVPSLSHTTSAPAHRQTLPSIHSYKHVAPSLWATALLLCLIFSTFCSARLVVTAASLKHRHALLASASMVPWAAALWWRMLHLGEDHVECLRCELGFHYGTPAWQDSNVLATSLVLTQVPLLLLLLVAVLMKVDPGSHDD